MDFHLQSIAFFNGLGAKPNYLIAITDTSGCSINSTIAITEPVKVSITKVNTTKVNGTIKGTMDIIATGGSGNFVYWINDSTPKSWP